MVHGRLYPKVCPKSIYVLEYLSRDHCKANVYNIRYTDHHTGLQLSDNGQCHSGSRKIAWGVAAAATLNVRTKNPMVPKGRRVLGPVPNTIL